jgi:5'-nucleotidase
MLSRRRFIKEAALTTGALLSSATIPLLAEEQVHKLTILHTNDVHSRLDPFPLDGGWYPGLGGIAARAQLIEKIRSVEEHVLLFDAGDIFQGTPYFNVYKGEPEIKAMSKMLYDASTMGNHDFDAGVENFAHQLQHANFPIVIANYDFSHTEMHDKYKPYTIFNKGNIKVGVFGIGIELQGLVPEKLYGNTVYLDPIIRANEVADYLKNKERCDMVICLSHLGYKYDDNKVSDVTLAKSSYYIDLIIGGHTHTFLDAPMAYKNLKNKEVLVNQVGWAGINLGRIDYTFNASKNFNVADTNTVVIRGNASV